MRNLLKNSSGFGLAEAVVAVGIIASFVVAVTGVNTLYISMAFENKNPFIASVMAEEGLEAVRFMRDQSWDNNIALVPLDVPFYLVFNNGWFLDAVPPSPDVFTRTVTFSAANRDPLDNIVAIGGTPDPDTRLVTISVSWQGKNGIITKNVKTYITDIFQN